MSGGCTCGREDAVEIDLDHTVPALVGIALERAVLESGSLAARPASHEPDTRIDARVRERHVEATVCLRSLVDCPIESGVIRDVGARARTSSPSS